MFLVQSFIYPEYVQGMAEYEDEPSSAVSSPMSGAGAGGWNTQAGPQLIEVEPELGGDGEKKFKCSFCPNKVFKKKPEVRIVKSFEGEFH